MMNISLRTLVTKIGDLQREDLNDQSGRLDCWNTYVRYSDVMYALVHVLAENDEDYSFDQWLDWFEEQTEKWHELPDFEKLPTVGG